MELVRTAFASSYHGTDKPKFFWWYPKGTSLAEKKLLTKIDFFILSYCCLGYFAMARSCASSFSSSSPSSGYS